MIRSKKHTVVFVSQNRVSFVMITRLRVDKDKPKGWFKGNWKGDYSKLCYFGPL